MKLAELAKELKIPTESFIKFIQDFDLELSECISTNFEVKDDFAKFARENIVFLRKYSEDLNQNKSIEDIAENIDQPKDKVAEIIKKDKPKLFDNGKYKSSVSSFGIDNKLGGNYKFVYNYFGKNTHLAERDFIGYRDLFFFVSQTLEPYLSNISVQDWGIHRPAGIVLYGPPGSGKIFWAKKIAEIIDYEFKEIKKYFLGISFVDDQKITFNDFLIQIMKSEKTLLFLEDFDEIMSERSEDESVKSDDEETKEIILHYISHFEKENILMVGAANSLEKIDRELLAPGRFDVLIPVFPPNMKERSEMLFHHMTEDLSPDALLIKILEDNKAHQLPFWLEISKKMQAFSNTMLIDFTQSLKKRIRNLYLKNNSTTIKITQKMLDASLRDASSKLTGTYLDQIQQFIYDVSLNNYEDFTVRIEALKVEVEHYKIVDEPTKPIGFTHNDEIKQKK
ncbi:ATP-binding protein [Kaistella flava (ex Peng et al. 2021)]|uniref:ATP-binding protein n=1 Tax=Kaistella flava (ex Peng et al. 2021) TaxID=2038776 RepID=A0A7M2Y673_9FLAO|nr:AAA family ATPase [Kaistella flava (ex Peng et al. 2021)]QOW09339.1 ATP-binding protein [Kaistella flava (ex Peng et al. 2021)]